MGLSSRLQMLAEVSHADYRRSPFGRYVVTPSCVLWVASPSLCGWHIWGHPDEAETRTLLSLLDVYPQMNVGFDVVADTRGVELVNTVALPLLVRWVFENRRELRRRVRMQANVIRREPIGFLLVGIIGSIGDVHPLKTFTQSHDAFHFLDPVNGARLCDEVEAIVARVRGVPSALQSLRVLLGDHPTTSLDEAARSLAMSARSLQRTLERHGTSFHDEQVDARFKLAKTLLAGSTVKIADVASRVGWSTSTLTTVFRNKTGYTPADWRKNG